MLNVKKLQAIRDKALGITVDPRTYGDLNSVVYLQQILDAVLGVTSTPERVRGNLNEKIYLQKIRNARLGVADGQFGSLSNSIYLQQIINACNGVADKQFGSLSENAYLDILMTVMSGASITYLLRDEFTDIRAAGSVNGTPATPGPGIRNVTDANSKYSIGSGVLNIATGQAAGSGLWSSVVITRVAGRAFFFKSIPAGAANGFALVGINSANAAGVLDGLGYRGTTTLRFMANGSVIVVGTYTDSSAYLSATVLRLTGQLTFIKGGTQYPAWTLLYPSKTGNYASAYANYTGLLTTGLGTADFMRVPQDLILIPCLASDSFNRANGALGVTDGAGVEGTGGIGLAWTSQLGTWGIATSKAACSALDGGTSVGVATVACANADVIAEVVATRSAGTSGLCLRYTNATNYIKAVHNGTNVQVIEVVAGVPNTLVNTAAGYGATNRLIVSLSGNKLRTYYNDVLIGAEATTAITTGTAHGLFTDDTGATFDSFAVWMKGTNNEYESYFSKYAA